ncbi:MAG: hypothetical protein HY644_00955 [Acidobacteria bacterium]|nr:hypothetical protein [Acidobacteriota bacterium]
MTQHNSERNPLEDFVQGYFQDLKQDLQELEDRLEQLQRKLAGRLDGVGREPYLQELSRRLEDMVRREKILPKLAEAFRDFGAARDEAVVLDGLIRYSGEIAPRVLLLVRRGDHWVRFQQGELEEGDRWPAADGTVYERAAERRAVVANESASFPGHRRLHEVLGGEAAYCAAVPLAFGESVPAVLYADAPGHEHLNVAGLEVLCHGARLAIRALRMAEKTSRIPEPLAERRDAVKVSPFKSQESFAGVERAPDHPIGISRGVAPSQEPNLAEQSVREVIETAAVFQVAQERTTSPGISETPPAVPPPDSWEPLLETAAAAPLTEDEERQHADARRFARLLVSELKLYNEQAVIEGRRNRDIYLRLKQDIDRSREMYNRRVPASVTRRCDYFHEEMVKVLAEGDAVSLGGEYPGSQADIT